MRLGARKCPDLGAQLERALDREPIAVGGGGGFVGLRASNIVRQRILKCLGSCIRIEKAEHLFGMKHGERVELGACMLNREKLRFDFWVPHDGIAIDSTPQSAEQFEAKRAWCESQHILYAYAGPENVTLGSSHILNESYFDQLQALIDERRQKVRP